MPIRLKHSTARTLGSYPEEFDDTISYRTQLDALEMRQSMSPKAKPGDMALVWHLRIFDEDGTAFIDPATDAPWDLWSWTDMDWWTNVDTGKRAKPVQYADAFMGHELTDEEIEDIDNEGWEESLVGKYALVSYEIKPGQDGTKRVYVTKMRPYRERRPRRED